MLKEGQVIELEIKKIGINGEGIGYYQKLAVFVDAVLPGEIVEIRLTKVLKNMAYGELVTIIEASKDRLEIKHPELQACGAYDMQHVKYDALLKMKRDSLINALNRYVHEKIPYHKVKQMIGMEDPFHYRNKVSLPVRKIGGKNHFGLYAKNTNEFIVVEDVPVHSKQINQILKTIEQLMDEFKFDAYIQKEKSGYMKACVIRETHYLKEVQVSFLCMRSFPKKQAFVDVLILKHPEIKSVYAFYADDYKEQVFFTKTSECLYGSLTIKEQMNQQVFYLYPEAFFQLNTRQAEKFYSVIKEDAKHLGKVAVDAYAGIAMVSHYIAPYFEKIYAIEIEDKSYQSAVLSLEENHLTQVEMIKKDFSQALKVLPKKIDVMIFNPPRTGLGLKTIKEVLAYQPKHLIYGSCNPSTLAKDLELLMDKYEVLKIQPVDMFPFTPLVESISMLELKEPNKANGNK